jgi:hypothetical protein
MNYKWYQWLPVIGMFTYHPLEDENPMSKFWWFMGWHYFYAIAGFVYVIIS